MQERRDFTDIEAEIHTDQLPADPFEQFRMPIDRELFGFFDEIIKQGKDAEIQAYCDQLDLVNLAYEQWSTIESLPYPKILEDLQKKEDEEFLKKYPRLYKLVEAEFGTVEERWEKAKKLRNTIIEILTKAGVDTEYTIIATAKGNLRLAAKAADYGLPLGQLYDPVRSRLVASSHHGHKNPEIAEIIHAETIRKIIKAHKDTFPIMKAVGFSRKNPRHTGYMSDVHDPDRNTLRGGSHSGIARFRLNPKFMGLFCEIQGMTIRTLKDMNERPGGLRHRPV